MPETPPALHSCTPTNPSLVRRSLFLTLSAAIREPNVSLAQMVVWLMEGYAERPAVGQRAVEAVVDDETGRTGVRVRAEFETITYGEIWARVRALLAAWQADGIQAGDFIATIGFTSIDYTIVDLACVCLGAVSVPLQANASQSQLASILAETEPRIVATSVELLEDAVQLLTSCSSTSRLVVFDYHAVDDDQRERVEAASRKLAAGPVPVPLESIGAAIERGASLPEPELLTASDTDERLSLIIYTSGSTGAPKGAMYTEKLVKAMWLTSPLVSAINVNYSPMSHLLGRTTLASTLARGGTAYFTAKSDLSTLFDDIASVRPTEMTLVPRICDMVFQRFKIEVARQTDIADDRTVIETEVKSQLRQHFFGGRVMSVICGSAPLAPEMKAFIESVFDLTLHDGYGSTEAGNGIIIDNRVRRPPVIDYRLVDVPELGYFATDLPHPRGELLLKTTSMIPGYYKRPDVTAEVFDADGFYRTGDIVAELAPDELVYLDRRNNVIKLSQGEFVTVAKLEADFAASPEIHQIYLYGSSERAYLLAVIVPTPGRFRNKAGDHCVDSADRQRGRTSVIRDSTRLLA